jgi:hypothetical protein
MSTRSHYISRLLMIALAFLSGFFATFLLGGHTQAAEFQPPFRFQYPEALSVLDWFTTPTLSDAVDDAILDYDDTDLTVSHGPIQQSPFVGSYANVIYYQANYGVVRWEATARQTLSRSRPCFSWNSGYPTGVCDKTDNKADFAYLAWNDYYASDFTDTDWDVYTVKHEFGHPLGRSHTSCGTLSIMNADCPSYPTALQQSDIDEINSWY